MQTPVTSRRCERQAAKAEILKSNRGGGEGAGAIGLQMSLLDPRATPLDKHHQQNHKQKSGDYPNNQ